MTPTLTIGSEAAGALTYGRYWDAANQAWRDNWEGGISLSSGVYSVVFLGRTKKFTLNAGSFVETEQEGESLTFSSATNTYTYVTRDGLAATYSKALAGDVFSAADEGRLTSFTSPDGVVTTLTYVTLAAQLQRLQSVESSRGYQLKFEYQSNTADANGLRLTKVTGINTAVEYCDATTNGCSGLTQAWPSLTFGWALTSNTVTDSLGRVTRYTISPTQSSQIVGIRRPSASADTTLITYSDHTIGRVQSVGDGTNTWTYSVAEAAPTRTITVTAPGGSTVRTVVSDIAKSTMSSDTDGRSKTTNYQYDASNRLTRITAPEGNYTQISYDGRGNITETRRVAKTAGSPADIVTSASYPTACSNIIVCNKPTSITDPRGGVTDYTYDATHGGALTITAPAPTAGAVRPQVRYTYAGYGAWRKTTTGSTFSASGQIIVPVGISTCATTTSCTGSADEIKSTLSYTTGSSSLGSNLLPLSVTSGSGNGALAATTGFTFDTVGNLQTVDGPLAGADDTTRYRYDAARQVVGVIGPDPDGAGVRKRPSTRTTYNVDGQAIATETGAVAGLADADWAAMTVLNRVDTTYDSYARPVRQEAIAGGITYAQMQMSYDTRYRLDCMAQRLNPATFAAPPSSACTLATTGSDGADRIAKYAYNNADLVTSVVTGYGTSAQRTETTRDYTNNGQLWKLTDANGNLTTYEYDGHDRASKTFFPSATTSGVSSTTDYEQVSYDSASNVTQLRRRDGAIILANFDALNRMTFRDAPTPVADVTYAYDNLNRLTSAAQPNNTISFAYDALGRQINTTGQLGTLNYQYNLAGARTRVTFPDTFYIEYVRDALGLTTSVRENGATSGIGLLATFAYDDYGRRTSLSRANGVVTSYSYDAISRLSGLTLDAPGTSIDESRTYAYTAAGQIKSRTSSNASYAFVPSASSTSYQKNGLNQYAAVDGATTTSDARGNLTGDGIRTYGYDVFNRLTSVSSGPTLIYDPLDRLAQITAGATTTRFLSESNDVVAEFDGSGALLRRYVMGPDGDEPLVWYEGSGTADRRFFAADERGSIISISGSTGASFATNTYDEYGLPGSANIGLFGFSGQVWLANGSVYHLRARAYSASIGRFLQPDPAGYLGGMNLYEYSSSDPTNRSDPSGLDDDVIVTHNPNRCPAGLSCFTPAPWENKPPLAQSLTDPYGNQAKPDGANGVLVTARRPFSGGVLYENIVTAPPYDLIERCNQKTETDLAAMEDFLAGAQTHIDRATLMLAFGGAVTTIMSPQPVTGPAAIVGSAGLLAVSLGIGTTRIAIGIARGYNGNEQAFWRALAEGGLLHFGKGLPPGIDFAASETLDVALDAAVSKLPEKCF